MDDKDTHNEVPMDQMATMFQDITETNELELKVIEQEITRAKAFVTEAGANLGNGFKRLQALSLEQQHILDDLVGFIKQTNVTGSDEIELYVKKMTDLVPQISAAVTLEVRSLQFEDLTNQTLSSLQENIDSIRDLSAEMNFALAKQKNGECLVMEHIHQKCQEIKERIEDFESHRSVTQHSMDEGDIELF